MERRSALWWHIFETTGSIEAYLAFHALENREEQ